MALARHRRHRRPCGAGTGRRTAARRPVRRPAGRPGRLRRPARRRRARPSTGRSRRRCRSRATPSKRLGTMSRPGASRPQCESDIQTFTLRMPSPRNAPSWCQFGVRGRCRTRRSVHLFTESTGRSPRYASIAAASPTRVERRRRGRRARAASRRSTRRRSRAPTARLTPTVYSVRGRKGSNQASVVGARTRRVRVEARDARSMPSTRRWHPVLGDEPADVQAPVPPDPRADHLGGEFVGLHDGGPDATRASPGAITGHDPMGAVAPELGSRRRGGAGRAGARYRHRAARGSASVSVSTASSNLPSATSASARAAEACRPTRRPGSHGTPSAGRRTRASYRPCRPAPPRQPRC